MPTAAFYSATDDKNAVGLVALLNSLRLSGHDERMFVVDLGLSELNRQRLAAHVEVVPPRAGNSPHFQKYAFPPADVDAHVVVDADVIVTRSLNDLIDDAVAGAVVAFADDLVDRFVPEWGPLAGLERLERRPYVNAGFVIVPTKALGLLDMVLEREQALDFSQSLWTDARADAPFLYWDQDLLNAVLASGVWPEVRTLEHRLAPHPPFPGLALIDDTLLQCQYLDGASPYILHHVLAKPWRAHTRPSIYSSLLRRLLLRADVPLRLPPRSLPLRLREGRAAAGARAVSTAHAYAANSRTALHIRAGRLHRLLATRRSRNRFSGHLGLMR